MTKQDIEYAAKLYISTGDIMHRQDAYYSFIAGAYHRQIEIDKLKSEIDKLKSEIDKLKSEIEK